MDAMVARDRMGRKTVAAPCDAPCPIERGMRILGGKWTGSILWHLKDEPVRFNDLTRMIGGASKKMIADRLRQLEAQGLVRRRVFDAAPVGVDYALTPRGETALACLDQLRIWSEALPEQLEAAA